MKYIYISTRNTSLINKYRIIHIYFIYSTCIPFWGDVTTRQYWWMYCPGDWHWDVEEVEKEVTSIRKELSGHVRNVNIVKKHKQYISPEKKNTSRQTCLWPLLHSCSYSLLFLNNPQNMLGEKTEDLQHRDSLEPWEKGIQSQWCASVW